jgi:hypothetical protein
VRAIAGLAVVAAVVVVAAGCGGESSAEASFRTNANQTCRSVARDVVAMPARERHELAAGLELFHESATRLAHVHAPARDARIFHDLVARLRDAAASSRAHSAEIYALDHRFAREMKNFGSRFRPGTKPPHVNMHLVERIDSLARTPLRDIRRAGKDARALKLSACAFGVSSRVSTQLTNSP